MVRQRQDGMAGEIKNHSERAYRFHFNQYALSELLIQWTIPPYSVFQFSFLPFHPLCFPRFSCTQCTVTLWQIPLQQSVTFSCTAHPLCLKPLMPIKFLMEDFVFPLFIVSLLYVTAFYLSILFLYFLIIFRNLFSHICFNVSL